VANALGWLWDVYEEATPIGSVGEEKNTHCCGLLADGELRA
jgi:hypothetical protein